MPSTFDEISRCPKASRAYHRECARFALGMARDARQHSDPRRQALYLAAARRERAHAITLPWLNRQTDMNITPITHVREAFARALALAPNREAAIYATAQSLALPVEAVREAVEEATHG